LHEAVVPVLQLAEAQPLRQPVDGDDDVGAETLAGKRLDGHEAHLVGRRVDLFPLSRHEQREAVVVVGVGEERHDHARS